MKIENNDPTICVRIFHKIYGNNYWYQTKWFLRIIIYHTLYIKICITLSFLYHNTPVSAEYDVDPLPPGCSIALAIQVKFIELSCSTCKEGSDNILVIGSVSKQIFKL